jgi:hypothetical protein
MSWQTHRMSGLDGANDEPAARKVLAGLARLPLGRFNSRMKARLVSFGHLEIEGEMYRKDVVVDGGRIRKRDKGPSKELMRKKWAHTPLTAAEDIPWGGKTLIIGTGAHGELPIWDDVREEAARRGIEIQALPTEDACRLVEDVDAKDVHAIFHVTC